VKVERTDAYDLHAVLPVAESRLNTAPRRVHRVISRV
jgi:hypothetical protein